MVLQQQSQSQQQQGANKHLLSAFQSAAGQQRALSPLTGSLANQRNHLAGHHQQPSISSAFKPSILPAASSSQQASSRLINLTTSHQMSHAKKNVPIFGQHQQQQEAGIDCNSCSSSQASISSTQSDSLSLSPISSQHSSASSTSHSADSKQRRELASAAAAAAATNIGIMQQQQQINMQQQQQQAQNSSRYKTELCRPFEENGTCKYGEKCQFAHGLAELRTLARHPKYKTEFCRTFHTTGFCPYGPRCHFIHNGRGPAPAHITQQSPQPPSQQQQQQHQTQSQTEQQAVKPKQLIGQQQDGSSPSSSPLSSACSSASSSSSSSSSSGKGSSVCSPPSCSESPPALSSSPDSSMLGSSSISCSPNHHHTEHQLQELSITRNSQRQTRINPFPCSLSAQLRNLNQHEQQHAIKPQQLSENFSSPSSSSEHVVRRNAPGLSLPSQEQSLLFNKPVGFDRFSGAPSNQITQSNGAQIVPNGSQYNSSHAFLWLHSQLNNGNKQLESNKNQPLNNLQNSHSLVNSAFASDLSLLASMSVGDERASETWTNQQRVEGDEQASGARGDQLVGESRWSACSGLAMSQASVAATRRTWQMQA